MTLKNNIFLINQYYYCSTKNVRDNSNGVSANSKFIKLFILLVFPCNTGKFTKCGLFHNYVYYINIALNLYRLFYPIVHNNKCNSHYILSEYTIFISGIVFNNILNPYS